MNLALWLARSAAIHGGRVAIAHGDRPVCTFEELAACAARGARWMVDQGLRPGDRVALFMANHPDYIRLFWAAWWGGAVVVPVNAKLHGREAAYIVSHSEAGMVFCDTEHASAFADHAPPGCRVLTRFDFLDEPSLEPLPIAECAEDDPMWLFYTSGTTGKPKGVTLTPRNLRWMTLGFFATVQSVAPGDAILHPAPLSHGSGMYHIPYLLNGGVNVVPASGGFEPPEIAALVARWRNASLFAAPTMVKRLVDWSRDHRPDWSGLATIVYGGGPMYLADIEEALELIGPHFAQIYGQGEAPMTITVLPRDVVNDSGHPRHRQRLASVGFAQPMLEVSIRSPEGEPLAVGEAGEVCVRGEVVMQGYWRQPEATAAAIRDGWLYTGDIGALDADGFLTLLDRSKDMIISGGTNIYPREVEEALLMHPAVAEVGVIGAPHPEWGESVVAYVVARAQVDHAELDAHCLQHIARFKRPRHYRFVDALPKNNYGKVLKTELREMEARRSATPG